MFTHSKYKEKKRSWKPEGEKVSVLWNQIGATIAEILAETESWRARKLC